MAKNMNASTAEPAMPIPMEVMNAAPRSSPPMSIGTNTDRAMNMATMSQGLSDDCFAIVL